MEKLYDLRKVLCRELDKISDKHDISAGDLEMAHKLTGTIKNIDKILMYEDDDGYSRAGNWRADMSGTYGGGHSYARRRDSMGRYSRDGDMMYSRGNDLVDKLEEKMRHARTDRERDAIRRCIDVMQEV